jgi:hypothetical protein
MAPGKVREAAEEVIMPLFKVVRGGILELLEIDSDTRASSEAMEPTSNELSVRTLNTFLVGIVSDETQLSAEGVSHPHMKWSTEILETSIDDDVFHITLIEHVYPVCAPGVEFETPTSSD